MKSRPKMQSIALPGANNAIQIHQSIEHGNAQLVRRNLNSLLNTIPTTPSPAATTLAVTEMVIFCQDMEPFFVRPSGGTVVTLADYHATTGRWLQEIVPAVNTVALWAPDLQGGPPKVGLRRVDILANRGLTLFDGLSVGTHGTSFDMHLM